MNPDIDHMKFTFFWMLFLSKIAAFEKTMDFFMVKEWVYILSNNIKYAEMKHAIFSVCVCVWETQRQCMNVFGNDVNLKFLKLF